MSSHLERACVPDGARGAARALAAFSMSALMLLSSLLLLTGDAASDPVVYDGLDDTRTVVWDFDDPASYALTSTDLSGGDAVLGILNETDGDHEAADYSAGSIANLDYTTVPGSLLIGDGGPGDSYETQPGPEGVDTYISEARVSDNFGTSFNLYLDSEADKRFHILMQLDVSAIPGLATITNATLWLYQMSGSRGADVAFNVHSLSVPFIEEETNWLRSESTIPWTDAGGDYENHSYGTYVATNAFGWLAIDLSELVEGWVTGAIENKGIILVPVSASGDNQKVFQSSDDPEPANQRPKLSVNYTIRDTAGLFESRALGPGTNATFTYSSYSTTKLSRLDDDFSGDALSPKWAWTNDPTAGGGSYDVGETRPGWLHVEGETGTDLWNTEATCNFLHQEVTGDFTATTRVQDYFTESGSVAGLLLYESDSEWMYVAKAHHISTDRVEVVVCEGGASAREMDIVWTGYDSAYLRAERNSTGVWFYVSTDGAYFQLLHHHVPSSEPSDDLDLGLFMFANSLTVPVADFDHLTVTSPVDPTVEVRVRSGNSTSFSDPSWGDWESAMVISGQSALRETGRYLQYMVFMSTPEHWITPVFSGFDCWYELYAAWGRVETADHLATDFGKWYTLTTDETTYGGAATYYYSTDHGNTWITAGSGGSYSISSMEPYLRIRIDLRTYDTLSTPRIHAVSAVHSTAVAYLLVAAPGAVVAGQPFAVTVTAKDSDNITMTHWSGPITLTAMRVDAATPMDTNLAITSATITSGGQVTIPNELYTVADTILIRAAAQDAYGFSAPMVVSPGPVSHLTITPAVETLVEGARQTFYAEAADAFDNAVPDVTFTWSADEAIGTLSRTVGPSVTLTAGDAGASGYLGVSASGMDASMFITITHASNAPVFAEAIPGQTKYEDSGSWAIDLSPYVQDAVHPDDQLRWFVTGENVVDVSGENRTGNMVMTLSTIQDQAGTDVLTVCVIDPDGLSATTNFSVNIIPVNDWPVISIIDPLAVRYDILYIYNMKYYVHDVDNDETELSLWVDDASSEYVSVSDLTLYMTYPRALNGTTQTVVVTVSDGTAHASATILVTVSRNNVPVSVVALPDVHMYQGEVLLDVFDIRDYFVDPEGESLSFSYNANHVLVDIDSNYMVSFFAPTDWYGVEPVVFSAADPEGARAESAASVLVHLVNQAPVVEGVPDLTVKYDLPYEFDLTRYVHDPDNDLDDLHVTTDDARAVSAGMVLTLEYPESMNGSVASLRITVSDGELSDSCIINVTIGSNTPPTASALPMHSFQEDLPTPYPSSGGLEAYFQDEEEAPLSFEVFTLTQDVSAIASEDDDGVWRAWFDTTDNWYGRAWFVIRATDPGGALVEAMAELTVNSVGDAPVLDFNETIEVTVGVQKAVNLYAWTSDPDVHMEGLEFSVSNDHAAYATLIEGVLVLEFPDDFLDGDDRRQVEISITVFDPDGLHDTDTLSVVVVAEPGAGSDTWLMVGMLAMAAVASGSFVVAMRLRKKPFVIRDLMIIHNDGFLIGRAAQKKEGEIDEDILSGMLTAVLNFVEDSMAKTQDGLKSFGFEHYKVLVKRAGMTYIAVVYEGDAPDNVEERLEALLAKVEKIYRKRIENWTGDMDTDFAGIEVLLQAFVRENSRKGNGLNGKKKDGNGREDKGTEPPVQTTLEME